MGDIPVEDQQFGAKMRAKYGASAQGSPMSIKVRRGTETVTLTAKLQFAPGDMTLEVDPAASDKAVRIRTGILKERPVTRPVVRGVISDGERQGG